MARAKRSSSSSSGESKRGLVVTLVFFILATIGAGVAAYYGFAEQEKLRTAAKEAEKKQADAEKERDLLRFQANMGKIYVGVAPEPADLQAHAIDMRNYQSGSLFQGNPELAKQKPSADAFVKKLTDRLPYNPDINQPTRTGRDAQPLDLFKLLAEKDAQLAQLAQERNQALQGLATARADLKRTQTDLKTAQDAYAAEVNKLKQVNAASLADYLRKLRAAEKSFQDVNNEKFDKAIELAQQVVDLNKDKRALEKIIRDQRDKLGRLEAVAARTKEARPVVLKPLGKIIRVAANGKRAYIDLGSNDGVKAQTTFSVYGIGPNGQPEAQPKGTVEVLDAGPRTSEVVITRMFAPDDQRDYYGRRTSIEVLSKENTDPISRGDVLINPTWNPNLKTHVAIAGIVDYRGDGANNVETFIRNLEKQNIIVDAYMDPQDGSIKGPGISQRTDMLVLASAPAFGALNSPRSKDKAEAVLKNMAELQKAAEKNGLAVIQLRRFIEQVGYKVPRYAQRRSNIPGISP